MLLTASGYHCRSRSSEAHDIMSRSVTHYAASTAASRSYQQTVNASRSLSRSHEERSPRTGRRVVQQQQPPSTSPHNATLTSSHISRNNGLNKSASAGIQSQSTHSLPSSNVQKKNALAASITQQVHHSVSVHVLIDNKRQNDIMQFLWSQ